MKHQVRAREQGSIMANQWGYKLKQHLSSWEHKGDKGPHKGHHLHADDMQDVHCVECGEVLSDADADAAWPMD